MHRRHWPREHTFCYPSFFLLLPLRRLRTNPDRVLRRNRAAWVAFHDADHGDGGPDALAWAESLLAREGIACDGEIWLQCFPRVAGFAFKPVSFWYCTNAAGRVTHVLAEVHNTFGERHVYLLQGQSLTQGGEVVARKALHVSPFARVEGRYRFRFTLHLDGAAPRCLAHIKLDDDAGRVLITTSLSGRLVPLGEAQLRRAALLQPLHALLLVVRIHWQALRLWLKGVPWFRKPQPPGNPITRSRP